MSWKDSRRRAILKFGRKSRKTFNRLMIGSSLVGDPVVFEPEEFPWIRELQNRLPEIQRELRRLLEYQSRLPGVEEISPDHSRIARERRWRSVFLHAYGYRSDPICRLCPETARLVDAVPGLETAFFSVLTPGAHLPPHRGVTKAIITCHLPLIVPANSEACWMGLDGTRYHWKVGEPFIFDDTREHEVRNDSDDNRVVLLMHVRRPLRFPGSMAGSLFMAAIKASPFIRDGVRNQRRFEKEFVAAIGEGGTSAG